MEKHIVEINGVKLEVDLRTAKRIENYKVGDPVKVLTKHYGDNYKSNVGVIVGFDAFVALPTITIMYVEQEYNNAEIKFVALNSNTKDIEIAPMHELDELRLTEGDALRYLERNIEKISLELEIAKTKLVTFKTFVSRITQPTLSKG